MSFLRKHWHFVMCFVPMWVCIILLILVIPSPSVRRGFPYNSGEIIQQIPNLCRPSRIITTDQGRSWRVSTVRAY